MARHSISFLLNGEAKLCTVDSNQTLAEILRERFGLTGTKIGCDHGECGACTVLLNRQPVLSCITLAMTIDGSEVDTIEGLSTHGKLHPIQQSFLAHGAVQCGFCTPGMINSTRSILEESADRSEEEIRQGLSGNLCRCTGYSKIVEAVRSVSHPTDSAESDDAYKIDGVAQVTGSAQYTDDFYLPRMLYGKILRSPHAHARIKSIDVSKAEKLPGVVAVMTGKELPKKYGILPSSQDENVLCIDKVRFVGDGVAAVAAVDERTAQEACKLIKVEYELLPSVLTIDEAFKTDLPKIHEDSKYDNNVAKHVALDFGNVKKGFEEADYVREDEFFYGANTHAMLEPHSAVASFEPSRGGNDYGPGHLTLWSSTQTPHYVHRTLASVLEMPESHIRVIKPFLGGGFGGKSEPFALEFCASWLSIKTGRPVKITHSREEVFYSHRGRHATKMWIKTGVKKDGRITALQYKSWLDGGAYGSFGIVTSYYTAQFLTLPYKVPSFKFETWRLYTNKAPSGPKRGHGAPQPRFAFEVHFDRIAGTLGLDPAEIRKRNLVESNSMTINSLRITSCGIRECIEKVVEASGWKEKRGKLPPGRGIGLAASAYISGAGKEIYWLGLPHSGAIIKIDRGGGVAVFCGSSDIGQGSRTVMARIASRVFGIDISHIKVFEADTDLTPVDLGSYSSRVTFMAGNAVLSAAHDLKKKIIGTVSEEFQLSEDRLEMVDGEVVDRSGSGKKMSFQEAVRKAEAKFGTLTATGWYAPPKLGGTYKGSGAGPSPSYSFSAHVAEVLVDQKTGKVRIEKVWSAHDCGKAISRTMVEGQIEGSVVMGIGEALYESLPHLDQASNTNSRGLLRNTSLIDYKIPSIEEAPPIETFIIESNDPEGPLGAKEAGEGPILAVPPAIANAIHDAVGVWPTVIPMTPDVLMKLMREKGSPAIRRPILDSDEVKVG